MKSKGFVFVETIVVIVILTVGLVAIYSSFSNLMVNEKKRAMYNDIEYIHRSYYIEDFISSLNLEDHVASWYEERNTKYLFMKFSCDDPDLYLENSVYNSDALNKDLTDEEKEKLKEEEEQKSESLMKQKQTFCNNLINSSNVENIIITKYDLSDIKEFIQVSGQLSTNCQNSSLYNKLPDYDKSLCDILGEVDENFLAYVKTLKAPDKKDGDLRVIIEYKEPYNIVDETVTLLNPNSKNKCNDGKDPYTDLDGKCCPNGYTRHPDEKGKRTLCIKEDYKTYYSSVKMVKSNKIINNDSYTLYHGIGLTDYINMKPTSTTAVNGINPQDFNSWRVYNATDSSFELVSEMESNEVLCFKGVDTCNQYKTKLDEIAASIANTKYTTSTGITSLDSVSNNSSSYISKPFLKSSYKYTEVDSEGNSATITKPGDYWLYDINVEGEGETLQCSVSYFTQTGEVESITFKNGDTTKYCKHVRPIVSIKNNITVSDSQTGKKDNPWVLE